MSGQPAPLPTSVSRACPALDDIVRRCLAKDRADRWGSAADITARLGQLLRPAARPPRWSFATRGGRSACSSLPPRLGILGSAWLATNGLLSRVSGPIVYSLAMPGRTGLSTAYGSSIAAAQDGSGVVYRGGDSGRSSCMGQYERGTGVGPGRYRGATNPFLSADARWLGFSRGGKLQRLPLRAGRVVEGSEAAEIAGTKRAAQGRGAAWAADGSLVYGANGTGLWYLPAGAAEARALTRLDPSKQEAAHGWPTFLPGDRLVLFTVLDASGRFDRSSIALLSLDTGRWSTIVKGGAYARYVPSGHIIYARKGSLVAVPSTSVPVTPRGMRSRFGTASGSSSTT